MNHSSAYVKSAEEKAEDLVVDVSEKLSNEMLAIQLEIALIEFSQTLRQTVYNGRARIEDIAMELTEFYDEEEREKLKKLL